MIDYKNVKLGKKAPRLDPRTLRFAKYIQAVPSPPIEVDYLPAHGPWPMYANDSLGDCVEAAAGHMIDEWQYCTQPDALQPTTAQIIQAYSGATGYVPGDPLTDQGTDMLTFLKYWRKTGVGGHKILAFVSLETGNLTQLEQAIWLFGASMIGLALPISAQNQSAWSVPGNLQGDAAPGSWGGHCVPVGAYRHDFPSRLRNTVVTWGQTLTMSDYFYQCYCDEAYAVLSQDWIEKQGVSPSGFDLAALQADLAAL